MSQQLQVLKCYSCETFQVHIVKKSTKWDCKMCGEKQTIKKIYGQGSGADCRHHVQLLNELRMQNDSIKNYNVISEVDNGDDVMMNNMITSANTEGRIQQVRRSKWDKYMSAGSNDPNAEEIESDWSISKISCKTSKVKVKDKENYNDVNGQGSQEHLNFNLFDDFGEYDIFEHEMQNEDGSIVSATSSNNTEAVTYHTNLLSNLFGKAECDDGELYESISSNNNEAVTYHRSLISNVFCKQECDDGELDEILRL